jgi:hypothetical protein
MLLLVPTLPPSYACTNHCSALCASANYISQHTECLNVCAVKAIIHAHQAKTAIDWANAKSKLSEAEAAYEQAKKDNPEQDFRTTESGGPAFRKAIKDLKKAYADKDVAAVKTVLGVMAGMALVG